LFWNFVVQHATFLINCTPTPLLQKNSPYEKLNGNLCDLSNLRVFGCLCYSNTLTSHRKKLDARSGHGVFLGFHHHTKGYIFLNLKNHKIEVSRHVIFHETNFPYQLTTDVQQSPNNLSLPMPPNYDSKCDLSFSTTPYIVETTATTNVENVVEAPPRRSTRSRRPPTYLEDFQTDLPAVHNVSSNYPLSNYVSYHALSPSFKHMILPISSHMEPRNYNEAS